MRSPSSVVALLVGFVLALSILVSAQSATTSLRGTVYDSKGAVVSGATVTITDNQTGFARTAKTGSKGEYQFVKFPPATYVVTVAATGFAMLKEENVRLMVSTPATLNFTVAVQGQTVTVEVAGTAALVNTTDATLGHAFGTEKLESLPFEGRDPVGILSLQPGVVFIGEFRQINQAIDSRGGSECRPGPVPRTAGSPVSRSRRHGPMSHPWCSQEPLCQPPRPLPSGPEPPR